MSIRLSHSAKDRYLRCPLSYHMHYNLRLREEIIGSPLLFGSAIDDGLNVMVVTRSLEDAIKAFDKSWTTAEINGVSTELKTSKLIRYSKADNDESLITEDMIIPSKVIPQWVIMQQKGHMMLTAYYNEVLPKIKKVLEVQKYFSLPNGNGDEIIGYLDLLCEWEDGRVLILDNKTSSKKYADDKIETEGGQLALYKEAFSRDYPIDGVGYLVLEKGIRKREPRTRTQILLGDVSEELTEKTFDEFSKVLYGIRMGNFESNHPICNTYFGECICNLYHPSGGQDLTGLTHVPRGKR